MDPEIDLSALMDGLYTDMKDRTADFDERPVSEGYLEYIDNLDDEDWGTLTDDGGEFSNY